MKIRFLRPWYAYKPGQEFEFADGQANLMIRRGIVERVVEGEAKPKRSREKLVPPAAAHA